MNTDRAARQAAEAKLYKTDLAAWARRRAAEIAADPGMDITGEIRWLESVIEEAQVRLSAARVHLTHPVVIPEIHYMEHHHLRTEPLFTEPTAVGAKYGLLEQAFSTLCGMSENGWGTPIGASVGGCPITMAELLAEFGEDE